MSQLRVSASAWFSVGVKFFLTTICIFCLSPLSLAFGTEQGNGKGECPGCPGQTAMVASTGDTQNFADGIDKADPRANCRPPKNSNQDLSKFFTRNKSDVFCVLIANDYITDYRKEMKKKLDEIEKDTEKHYCYVDTDPAIYNAINCVTKVDNEDQEVNIFAFATFKRKEKMMEEFYKQKKYNIMVEDDFGHTVYDYVLTELNGTIERMNKLPQNDPDTRRVMQTQVDAWTYFKGVVFKLGGREGSHKMVAPVR